MHCFSAGAISEFVFYTQSYISWFVFLKRLFALNSKTRMWQSIMWKIAMLIKKKEKKIKCSVMLFNRCGCTSIRACWVCLKILILLQLQRKKNILIIHFRYHYWYTYMYFLVFSYKMYDCIELMQLELL